MSEIKTADEILINKGHTMASFNSMAQFKSIIACMEEYKSQSLPVENKNITMQQIPELEIASFDYSKDRIENHNCPITAQSDVQSAYIAGALKFNPFIYNNEVQAFKKRLSEWLKEIKPVPQSLPISNVDQEEFNQDFVDAIKDTVRKEMQQSNLGNVDEAAEKLWKKYSQPTHTIASKNVITELDFKEAIEWYASQLNK